MAVAELSLDSAGELTQVKPWGKWRPWQYAALLTALTAFVYYPGLRGPFIFDDQANIQKKRQVISLASPTEILRQTRPVGFITFAFDYAMQGMSPKGFRTTNIAIHIFSGWLLFGLIRRGLRRRGTLISLRRKADEVAFAMTLLWLIHPLPTSAVTYIVQRFESLMSCFLLLMLYALWRGARTPRTQRAWPWLGIAIAACWLGGGTKQVMVIAPFLAILCDQAFLAKSWSQMIRRRWWLHAALFGCWPVIWWTDRMGAANADFTSAGFGAKISSWEYLRSQPEVLLRYLRLVFWPDPLILDYHWPAAHDAFQIYGLGAVILALLAMSAALWWRWPRVGFVALSFFVILSVTSSILPIADLAMEYRMYLPTAPIIILTVLAVWKLVEINCPTNQRLNVLLTLFLIASIALGSRTLARNRDYLDSLKIWRQCAEFNPHNGRAQFNIAGRLGDRGALEEALPYYQAALASDMPTKEVVYDNLGMDFVRAGQLVAGVDQFRKALELSENDAPSRTHLADALRRLGEYQESRAQFERVLQQQPMNIEAQRGYVWLLATCPTDAIQDSAIALKWAKKLLKGTADPSAEILDSAAAAFAANGEFAKGVELMDAAIRQAHRTNRKLEAQLIARRELYASEQPFREQLPGTKTVE